LRSAPLSFQLRSQVGSPIGAGDIATALARAFLHSPINRAAVVSAAVVRSPLATTFCTAFVVGRRVLA
jgi:hypothetical protein